MITRATPADRWALKFIDALAAKNGHALGFLPLAAYDDALTRQRVLLFFDNDEPAGYLIHGPPKTTAKIYQVCIADDSRRFEHGSALVNALRNHFNTHSVHHISLHCAEDLEANAFWKAIGFHHAGRRLKRKDGSRWQNRYEWTSPNEQLFRLNQQRALTDAQKTSLGKLLLKGKVNLAEIIHRGNTRRHNRNP